MTRNLNTNLHAYSQYGTAAPIWVQVCYHLFYFKLSFWSVQLSRNVPVVSTSWYVTGDRKQLQVSDYSQMEVKWEERGGNKVPSSP